MILVAQGPLQAHRNFKPSEKIKFPKAENHTVVVKAIEKFDSFVYFSVHGL